MKLSGSNPLVTFRPHLGGNGGEITLATYDTDKHLNIIFEGGNYGTICAHPKDVIALRDEILKLYPVDNSALHNEAFNNGYAKGYQDGTTDTVSTSTYDPYNPVEGAKAQIADFEYFKYRKHRMPLTITKVDDSGRGDILVNFTDADGKKDSCFSYRLAAYVSPINAAVPPKAETSPKWEVVADGLDRVKVDGGYIYQSDTGHQTFVPNQPNATAGKTLCSFTGSCVSQRPA